jgi:hypothetical protein
MYLGVYLREMVAEIEALGWRIIGTTTRSSRPRCAGGEAPLKRLAGRKDSPWLSSSAVNVRLGSRWRPAMDDR